MLFVMFDLPNITNVVNRVDRILSPEILLARLIIAFLFYPADNCRDQLSLSGGSASYRVSSGCRLSARFPRNQEASTSPARASARHSWRLETERLIKPSAFLNLFLEFWKSLALAHASGFAVLEAEAADLFFGFAQSHDERHRLVFN